MPNLENAHLKSSRTVHSGVIRWRQFHTLCHRTMPRAYWSRSDEPVTCKGCAAKLLEKIRRIEGW
ncbi:MAG: hypothetical protein ACYS7Y_29545 [Planctomycetota bacterium]|jgi:hypothetical protein